MNKKNIKLDDTKHKSIKKYKDLMDLSHKIITSSNGAIKLRCSSVIKSLMEKNLTIERLQGNYSKFKDGVVKYHMDCIEKTNDENIAFLTAVQTLDMNGPYFDEILEKQMRDVRKNQNNDVIQRNLNDKENTYKHQMVSKRVDTATTLSPIYPDLMTLKRHDQTLNSTNKYHDRSVLSIQSSATSPSSSIDNSRLSPIKHSILPLRCQLNHTLLQKSWTKKTCTVCLNRDDKKVMYECRECGIFIHDCCRNTDAHKICITLSKLSIKNMNNLKALCGTRESFRPMVPNVFLAVMHHIHTFGLSTENIYTCEGKDKEVKDLCNKLIEGKLKYMIKADIRIVSNAFLMFLFYLQTPVLPETVVQKIESLMDYDEHITERDISACLQEMPLENQDTLVYVLLHLQIISRSKQCKFDAERLAMTFTPLLTKNSSEHKTIRLVKKLIELDIRFYDQNFLDEKVFFKPYLAEAAQRSTFMEYDQ